MRKKGHRRTIVRRIEGIITLRFGGKPVLTIAALLAVFLQTFVIQTHVDGLAGVQSAVSIARAAHDGSALQSVAKVTAAPKGGHEVCSLCEALASSGSQLLAFGPSLVSTHGIIAHEASIKVRWAPEPPAHTWQSRGPPLAL